MQTTPSVYNPEISLITTAEGLFQWQWKGYISVAFTELEDRRWTPLIIDSRLCFIASNGKQRCIVWGDSEGEWFDDTYDLKAHHNKPLYIARRKRNWTVIFGKIHSNFYPFQITYLLYEDGIAIVNFEKWNGKWDLVTKNEVLEVIQFTK